MKPILATTLRNQFKKVGEYEYYLKNIVINGVKKGCSGFIKNPTNHKIIYLTTEAVCYEPLKDKVMFRTAKHLKDYTGGINQWCNREELVEKVAEALK